VADRYGKLDVLVNNAAITYDTWQRAITADLGVVRQAAETNLYGPWQIVQRFRPLLRNSDHPRIVNVSSEAGSLTSMGGGTPAYTVSKVSLTALTRMLAAELRAERILVTHGIRSCSTPGSVRTRWSRTCAVSAPIPGASRPSCSATAIPITPRAWTGSFARSVAAVSRSSSIPSSGTGAAW
jgi:NAD(P)-dependent dehydrogenase (short-subunit alcohol dehydrogenase family)